MTGADYDAGQLQKAREEAGFTQTVLADRLNVSEKTISRAECGTVASFDLLKNMCRECGIDIKEIVFSTATATV